MSGSLKRLCKAEISMLNSRIDEECLNSQTLYLCHCCDESELESLKAFFY